MYWCLTRTGLYLSVESYVTCVNLLFSNSRVQSYIGRGRLLDLRTEVQTVPPDEDVGHVGIRRSSEWDFPRRRALFTSDGAYSGSSESDTSEGHVDRPPEGQYDADRRTEEGHDEDGVEDLGFPPKTLERALTQLRQERLPHGVRNHEKTTSGAGG